MSDLKDKCNGVEMQLSDREFDVERLKADIDRLQKALKVAVSVNKFHNYKNWET